MASGTYTKTKYRLSLLSEWVKENGRVPSSKETMAILQIENEDTAREYVKKLRKLIPDPTTSLDEIQRILVERLRERVSNKESPMNDSDMIRLMEFMFPKKSENKTTMEQDVTIGYTDELEDELAQYGKILGDSEKGDSEPL